MRRLVVGLLLIGLLAAPIALAEPAEARKATPTPTVVLTPQPTSTPDPTRPLSWDDRGPLGIGKPVRCLAWKDPDGGWHFVCVALP